MKEIVIGLYLLGAMLCAVLHVIAWLREAANANWRENWPVLIAAPFFLVFGVIAALLWPVMRFREERRNEGWLWRLFA